MDKIIILIINLLIIVIIKINKCNSLDITFLIDFNSRFHYDKSECGGSIEVDTSRLDNFFQENYLIYPPCKSFDDVGDRIRQLSLKSYENVSLFINIKPYDWKNQEITSNGIKIIPSFCHFSISMTDDQNNKNNNNEDYLITIQGRSEFIGYNFTNDMICYDNKNNNKNPNRMILKNLKFKKWGYPIIVIYQDLKKLKKPTINIEFSNIKTDESNVFLVSVNGNKNQAINFIIENCTFSNILNENHTTLIWVQDNNNIWIDKCKFDNINISMALIVNLNGILSIKNTDFNMITIKNQDPILFNQNQYIELNNINVNGSSFRSFCVQGYRESQTINNINKTNIIRNINFIKNTNTILKPILDQDDILTGLIIINGDVASDSGSGSGAPPTNKSINNLKVEITNVSIENFNQINDNTKNLIVTFNIHTLTINNIKISKPNQFKSSIFTNDTIIIINNSNSILSSNIFCEGINNLINIEINENYSINSGENNNNNNNNYLNNNLKKYCKNCTLNYITILNKNNKSNNNNYKNNNNNNNKKNNSDDDFKKILIIPIVLGGMVFLSLFIGIIIFRKRVAKRFGKNDNYDGGNSNNYNDIDRLDFGNIDNFGKLENESYHHQLY
ncbi:hypothetical protein DDB_G0278325 [Dictyostelium discoideum AX4]|uniref:Transmembrane protein n=1 Tax=Dictyostelium discoideum TaxID=44689 RepID=Q54YB0_DICDI|nr:hypothetical protein DDB_G0278325 [Dictyostelium discoideum AX4]EAL68335.1 hypothetical protein DDB_G0278325 [Dictyostelium discoideum AX4]|eukprot:XP_642292.1 hypothetical protein DDB_G0278325 [Dictyostelium discoideum AX4]